MLQFDNKLKKAVSLITKGNQREKHTGFLCSPALQATAVVELARLVVSGLSQCDFAISNV